MNFCAQRSESLLAPAAKQPGRRAQKWHGGSAYKFGAAQRLSHSFFLIDVIYSGIWDGEVPEEGIGNSESTAMLEGIKESTGTRATTFGFLTRYYVDGKMKHDVNWSTKTNVDKMKNQTSSQCLYMTPLHLMVVKLQFALSTSMMSVHFNVIPAIDQMVPSMTG